MYIPWQQILGGGFAASLLTKDRKPVSSTRRGYTQLARLTFPFDLLWSKAKVISSGKILDYQVEKCLDDKNNQRCSVPFPVTKSTS